MQEREVEQFNKCALNLMDEGLEAEILDEHGNWPVTQPTARAS
jgi:hypothetical protein